MVSDALYELCLPILKDSAIEDEDKTEKLEALIRKESSLVGKPLEDTVLNILWQFRDSKSPPIRHNIIRRSSPAPWQSHASTPLASPSLSGASPAAPHSLGSGPPGFIRSRSFNASPFTSPRPSPRLALASHIPHSPSLSSYEFSEPGIPQNDYGDYGSDTVNWLVNDDSNSRPSSSGAGSVYDSGLSGAAAAWIQPQQMSPFDLLRSVLGDGKSDEEIENALEASGYDLSTTLATLMGSQAIYPQEQTYVPEPEGQILIGKSMRTTQPVLIDQTARSRSSIVCKYWLSNGNCLRADCRFSHDLSSHICKYWVMGSCLAGESCVFSHDPALLINRLHVDDGSGVLTATQSQIHPSFQVQDYDAFPALNPQAVARNQWSHASTCSSPNQSIFQNYSGSPSGNGHGVGSRRHFTPRNSSMNGLSSSPNSHGSRPTSRHQSREPTPSIPAVDDNEAFPTLGSAGSKAVKKHHGKRGGHGHGHGKENQPNSLAELVRMSPSPAPGSLRKGLTKTRSYTGSRDNDAVANTIPAPQHIPWLETGEKVNQAYMKARQNAIRHGGLRNKFLQSAAQAWNRNDARAAKALSLRGQNENDLMRKAHREAAHILYEQRNKDNATSTEIYVDLHGLHPEEAVDYLESVLVEQQTSNRTVYAITGTGHHSKNGKDKMGKAIRTFLSDWKYAFREFGVAGGGDAANVGGILGVDPKSFDRSLEGGGNRGGGGGDEGGDGDNNSKGEAVVGGGGKIKVVKAAGEIPTGPRVQGKVG